MRAVSLLEALFGGRLKVRTVLFSGAVFDEVAY